MLLDPKTAEQYEQYNKTAFTRLRVDCLHSPIFIRKIVVEIELSLGGRDGLKYILVEGAGD